MMRIIGRRRKSKGLYIFDPEAPKSVAFLELLLYSNYIVT